MPLFLALRQLKLEFAISTLPLGRNIRLRPFGVNLRLPWPWLGGEHREIPPRFAPWNDAQSEFVRKISAEDIDAHLNEFEWHFNNHKDSCLFRDSILGKADADNMEYTQLTLERAVLNSAQMVRPGLFRPTSQLLGWK